MAMGAPRNLPNNTESEDHQRIRFQVELEFVQCLSNPNYLNFLAQRGYFKDQTFINYLKYLMYWKQPDYSKYLKYPQCLFLLELLQYEHFRKELMNSQCAKFIDDQQLLHWQHYQRKRIKLIGEQAEKAESKTSAAIGAAVGAPNSNSAAQSNTTTTNNTASSVGNSNNTNSISAHIKPPIS